MKRKTIKLSNKEIYGYKTPYRWLFAGECGKETRLFIMQKRPEREELVKGFSVPVQRKILLVIRPKSHFAFRIGCGFWGQADLELAGKAQLEAQLVCEEQNFWLERISPSSWWNFCEPASGWSNRSLAVRGDAKAQHSSPTTDQLLGCVFCI